MSLPSRILSLALIGSALALPTTRALAGPSRSLPDQLLDSARELNPANRPVETAAFCGFQSNPVVHIQPPLALDPAKLAAAMLAETRCVRLTRKLGRGAEKILQAMEYLLPAAAIEYFLPGLIRDLSPHIGGAYFTWPATAAALSSTFAGVVGYHMEARMEGSRGVYLRDMWYAGAGAGFTWGYLQQAAIWIAAHGKEFGGYWSVGDKPENIFVYGTTIPFVAATSITISRAQGAANGSILLSLPRWVNRRLVQPVVDRLVRGWFGADALSIRQVLATGAPGFWKDLGERGFKIPRFQRRAWATAFSESKVLPKSGLSAEWIEPANLLPAIQHFRQSISSARDLMRSPPLPHDPLREFRIAAMASLDGIERRALAVEGDAGAPLATFRWTTNLRAMDALKSEATTVLERIQASRLAMANDGYVEAAQSLAGGLNAPVSTQDFRDPDRYFELDEGEFGNPDSRFTHPEKALLVDLRDRILAMLPDGALMPDLIGLEWKSAEIFPGATVREISVTVRSAPEATETFSVYVDPMNPVATGKFKQAVESIQAKLETEPARDAEIQLLSPCPAALTNPISRKELGGGKT